MAGISGLGSMGLLFGNPVWRAFKNISDRRSEHLKVWSPSLLFSYKTTTADSRNLYEHL